MTTNKFDYIQTAGLQGMQSGYDFEDVVVDAVNNKDIQGMILVDEIIKEEYIDSATIISFSAKKAPKSAPDAFGLKKVPPKADMFVIFETTEGFKKYGISIKSSPSSIQVQITNVKRFKLICEHKGMYFSKTLETALSKFCGWNITPTEAEKCYLQQGDRHRWLIQELTQVEQNAIAEFFTTNSREVATIALKEGTSASEYAADYYVVNTHKYSEIKTMDIKARKMDRVIDIAIAEGFQINQTGSFKIGKLTMQMKGSGKKYSSAYHGFQINMGSGKWL